MTWRSRVTALFAFRMSRHSRTCELDLRGTTTNGLSHDVGPSYFSMMSSFCNRFTSSATFCLVCQRILQIGCCDIRIDMWFDFSTNRDLWKFVDFGQWFVECCQVNQVSLRCWQFLVALRVAVCLHSMAFLSPFSTMMGAETNLLLDSMRLLKVPLSCSGVFDWYELWTF